MTIVIVTGSREFKDEIAITHKLDELYNQYGDLSIIVGDAKGADAIAVKWCEWMHNIGKKVRWKIFEANWQRSCDENCYHQPRPHYCPVAGNIRNQEMIDFALTYVGWKRICIAFEQPYATNRGTRDCASRARKARIPVEIFRKGKWI